MENTSKALIIAGAILLAILLITMAIYVLNSSNNTVKTAEEAGQLISSGVNKSTGELKNVLGDIEGNLVRIEDHFAICGSKTGDAYRYGYLVEYTNWDTKRNPKVLLELDTQYVISFDYEIEEVKVDPEPEVGKTYNGVKCSVGYGETGYTVDINNRDGYYYYNESSPKKGSKSFTFTTGSGWKTRNHTVFTD